MPSITYNLQPQSTPVEYTCNVLPVNINFTGELTTAAEFWYLQLETTKVAEESEYSTQEDQQASKISVNYLRGRKLLGKHHVYTNINTNTDTTTNSNHSLLMFKKGETDFQKDSINYELLGNCNELVNYGHEKLPESNDPTEKLNEWLSLSECIHNDDDDDE